MFCRRQARRGEQPATMVCVAMPAIRQGAGGVATRVKYRRYS